MIFFVGENVNSKSLQLDHLFANPKKTSQFAVGFSILAHVLLVVVIRNMNFNKDIAAPVAAIENYVDLGYQTFDEVPQVVESITPQPKDIPDVVPDKSEPVTAAQEMQDQSSDVAGFQKEKTVEVANRAPTSANVTTVPYYKVKPKYPKEALVAGIEGHVDLEIDVEVDGTVDNLKATGGEKLSTFEAATLRAVSKWKYKPFVDADGNPIKKTKHVVRVDFKLQDEANTN